MNDLERDEQELLSRARAGLAPTLDTTARLRESIAAAVAAGAVADPRVAGARAAAPRGLAAGPAGTVARLIVVTAIAGSAGYGLGYRAGERRAARVPVAAASAPAPAPSRAALAEESPRPADVAPPRAPVARARDAAARPAPPPAPASAAESLAKEVTALRGVERALRDGQPGLAFALLQELDRTIPDGKLREEREATEAIARCALGRIPLGIDLAADFAEHHPDSVYLKRVEQSCARRSGEGEWR